MVRRLRVPASLALTTLMVLTLVFCLPGADNVSADDFPIVETSPQPSGPTEDYVPDEIIVKFKTGTPGTAVNQLNMSLGASVLRTSPHGGFKVLKIPSGKTVAEMVGTYRQRPIVEYAEPNYIFHVTWEPDDPGYYRQWHFSQINMEAAWDMDNSDPKYGGDPGIIVAVIDTGVAYEDYDNGTYLQAPDLAVTNFWTNADEILGNGVDDDNNGYVDDIHGWDFINNDAHPNDDRNHGTHVTGTIAQSTNNSEGVAGIAFNTTIMPVKVLSNAGTGTNEQVANGIYYATNNGAKIINLSLSSSVRAVAVEQAIVSASNAGVVVVAAVGNEGNALNEPQYPAAYDSYVIAVSATRYDQARAYYSNYGSYVDIAAPGGDMTVDQNGDGEVDGVLQQTFATGVPTMFGYYLFQGTSMAAPHVAGVAALVLAKHPTWTAAQVRYAIQATATDKGSAGRDDEYGWGLVNASAAIGASLPQTTSYKDNGYTAECNNFIDYTSEHTVYMKSTNLLPEYDYRMAYFDGDGDKRATEDYASDASGNLTTEHTFVNGTDVAGTWHVVICDAAHTPPSEYDAGWTYTIAEDTFTVQQSAIPEFPTVLTAFVSLTLCVGVYLLMRRKLAPARAVGRR